MTKEIMRLYLPGKTYESCFNLEVTSSLSTEQMNLLHWLLKDLPGRKIYSRSILRGPVVEVGPRLSYATPFSSNAVSIFRACGLPEITRCEISRRYPVPAGRSSAKFAQTLYDRMTEERYHRPLTAFAVTGETERVYTIPVLSEGREALKRTSKEMGFGWDEGDIEIAYRLFTKVEKRDPTNVELFQIAQANSDHSRHWIFKGKIEIDGEVMPSTLLELVMHQWKLMPDNSVIAFSDNSSAIWGFEVTDLALKSPWTTSAYQPAKVLFHALLTAETHNFPTGIAPKPGAETGTGGRIRDSEATGRGSTAIAGTAAYCAAHLLIPGYGLPWENRDAVYPGNMATPLDIIIKASDGASDYGNKFGEPVIAGFSHSIDITTPNGTRWAYIKPIMFTGGVGRIADHNLKKDEPEVGMKVVQIGGPAYRIGFGGGAASSQMQGDNKSDLDFNAVQRGDAEMEQRVRRAILACVNMSIFDEHCENIIRSIHDQGAGGPCNVVTELVSPAGGQIKIRSINLGDTTLPVVAIWGAEYQERYGLLIFDRHLDLFKSICEREHVPCEVLGIITGNGRIVLFDSTNDTKPVNLGLEEILGKLPQKTFRDSRAASDQKLVPFKLNPAVTLQSALNRVLRMLSVGSKEHYVHKVDRSVSGLVARQQCCGARQLPVSDVAVTALSHFGYEGIATAIGERTLMMLVNPEAGARMALAEALTNLVWADGIELWQVRASANWMWPAKLPGELAAMYDAASALQNMMSYLSVAIDGGKDSCSMATRVNGEYVKSPRELVISPYAAIPDVRRVITPDIKPDENTSLIYIDLGAGKNRMGGSALAYAYGQLGDECPDIDDIITLHNFFTAIQTMIANKLILAGHDKGDGGLITTLLEMAFAGGCGLNLFFEPDGHGPEPTRLYSGSPFNLANVQDSMNGALEFLFNEEAGAVIQVHHNRAHEVHEILELYRLNFCELGKPVREQILRIAAADKTPRHIDFDMDDLLSAWRDTSHHLRARQINPECARAERDNTRHNWRGPRYHVNFPLTTYSPRYSDESGNIPVAVIREEGTNGDKEMAASLHFAGFRVYDVTMSDLVTGRTKLDKFRGVIFPGGFSYADTLGSAKGWAAKILFNPTVSEMFSEFYRRPDTFSFGVCNGCQLMALLGWVPQTGLLENRQPVLVPNVSGKFESRWSTVTILPSPAIMLDNMEYSTMGIWVAHGEGRFHFPNKDVATWVETNKLAPIRYVDDEGVITEKYPFNPNGSPDGIAALCSEDGRHLAMMPHPERCTLMWQWPWADIISSEDDGSPWLMMFHNAHDWCKHN